MGRPLIDRLGPAPADGGFAQAGFFVWCGSLIEADGRYHLFASRWPEATGFPDGYRDHSEIVRASAGRPEGPFVFEEVVVAARGGTWWDGKMCHNPKILCIDGTYVLYYIGSALGSDHRQVGYAWAPSVAGPWTRLERPIPLGEDANNPAPLVEADGSVLLAYRDLVLRMSVARAETWDGPYGVVAEDILPGVPIEDAELFRAGERYGMLVEDNQAGLTGHERFGAQLESDDGVAWRPHDPVTVYTHTILLDDGTAIAAERRERPALFCDPATERGLAGEPTHLITAVLASGRSWTLIQPIEPAR